MADHTVAESAVEATDVAAPTSDGAPSKAQDGLQSEAGGEAAVKDLPNDKGSETAEPASKEAVDEGKLHDSGGKDDGNTHSSKLDQKKTFTKKPKENRNRFDPSQLPESDDPEEIRKQVEFYFSDSNLPVDKFLLDQVLDGENGAVPIKIIHDFRRMKRFQPFSAVVDALRDSEFLEVVDIDRVRRKEPLSSEFSRVVHENQRLLAQKMLSRTVYVKGFGEETAQSQTDIENFFAPYGPVNAIRLRRFSTKEFKGSAFVEFQSEEQAKAFLQLDPKPQYNGKELTVKSQEEYLAESKERHDAIEESKRGNKGRDSYRPRGGRRGGNRGQRRDHDRGSSDRKRKYNRGNEDRDDNSPVEERDSKKLREDGVHDAEVKGEV